jgi:hypothetical protein
LNAREVLCRKLVDPRISGKHSSRIQQFPGDIKINP